MTSCCVTVGFFVLSRCGNPAVTGCAQCRRPLCSAHVADGGLCPECAVSRGYGTHPTASPATVSAYRRRAFYASSSRHYGDSDWYGSLDEYDRAPFQPGGSAGSTDTDYGADDGSDLVDS